MMNCWVSSAVHSLTTSENMQSSLLREGGDLAGSAGAAQPLNAISPVPATAIVQNEDEKFVFVAASIDTFHRVDVTTGLETPYWVEIKEGLTEGQEVVDSGTFALKSELLLEHEAG